MGQLPGNESGTKGVPIKNGGLRPYSVGNQLGGEAL